MAMQADGRRAVTARAAEPVEAMAARELRLGDIYHEPAPGVGAWYVAHGDPQEARRRIGYLRECGRNVPCELFVPMERRKVAMPGRRQRREVDSPLFGPYMFLRMDMAEPERAHHAAAVRACAGDLAARVGALREAESLAALRLDFIRRIDGIARFVGSEGCKWPRPLGDMRTFQQLYAQPVVMKQPMVIPLNSALTLLDGPLAGYEGRLHRVLGSLDIDGRIDVLVSMMGRAVPIRTNIAHVELRAV